MRLFRLAVLICLGSFSFLLVHVPMTGSITAHCPPRFCAHVVGQPAIAAINSVSDIPKGDTAASTFKPYLAQAEPTPAVTASSLSARLPAWLGNLPIAALGVLASLGAGLATGVGALPILFTKEISKRLQGALLGFAAGVMLAATSFSLLIPSIERVTDTGGSQLYAAGVAVGGTLIGSGFIWLMDRSLPYDWLIGQPINVDQARLKGIWLFILAIAIHNFPEGLAVGVGFGGDDLGNGLALAIGIGLQNLPEGLAVALALFSQNYGRWRAFYIALLTGLLEPLGGLLGVGIISLGEALLPWGLTFAAGAMLFVIGDEVIPQAQYLESGKLATAGIVLGFIIMMFLDVTLGG